MDSTYKKEKWSLDTVSEIIGDLFCFDLILEIKRKLKNEEAALRKNLCKITNCVKNVR